MCRRGAKRGERAGCAGKREPPFIHGSAARVQNERASAVRARLLRFRLSVEKNDNGDFPRLALRAYQARAAVLMRDEKSARAVA